MTSWKNVNPVTAVRNEFNLWAVFGVLTYTHCSCFVSQRAGGEQQDDMGSPVPSHSPDTDPPAIGHGRKIIHVDMDAFYASRRMMVR